MQWLNRLIGRLLESAGLETSGRIGGSIQFFLYDTLKIMVLLTLLIFIISYIQSYFPPRRSRRILGRFRGMGANCIAALLGTVTPFCSRSSIPLFIGFTSAGLPLSLTFSFPISSPMVDLGSLVLLTSIFGWKVAVIYVLLGLLVAVLGGTVIGKLRLEDEVEEFIVELLDSGNPFGVMIATVAGVPMYADIFGTIPIAQALLAKDAQLGVVLSFMMGVTTLSLPSIIMLRKAVKPKLLAVFVAICSVGIILVGYFFNAIQHFII